MSILKYIPSKDELKECPLCNRPWTIVYGKKKTDRAYLVCYEKTCEIFIWISDPFVGKWAAIERINCVMCKTPMRFFCRSDEYSKWLCPNPKCRMSFESTNPEKHKHLNLEANEKDIIL